MPEKKEYDEFEMLYCDQGTCRVNTFERGPRATYLTGPDGLCPGCNMPGKAIPVAVTGY